MVATMMCDWTNQAVIVSLCMIWLTHGRSVGWVSRVMLSARKYISFFRLIMGQFMTFIWLCPYIYHFGFTFKFGFCFLFRFYSIFFKFVLLHFICWYTLNHEFHHLICRLHVQCIFTSAVFLPFNCYMPDFFIIFSLLLELGCSMALLDAILMCDATQFYTLHSL